MGTLDGKVALVTGAARGQGRSHAVRLAEEGADIIAIDVCTPIETVTYRGASEADLAETAAEVEKLDRRIVTRKADVRDLSALQSAVAGGLEEFGRLDIVVANAGVGSYGSFLELTPEHLEEMIDVNLKGTLYAVRAALPHLIESGEGDVITLASEAGRRGIPGEAVYCASKFGQVGFTRALDGEVREHGIRATNVCPGGVATDFALDDGRGRTPDVLPGMMTADDVAEVVVFVLERPRHMRILETAFRPIGEGAWG
jgi:meso-butanediol dehydrogenase / (S,S)-butanediol dehydrogenase / diacetyl reductase